MTAMIASARTPPATVASPIPSHIVIKHEHKANNVCGGSAPPLPLVDEIDLQQCLVFPQPSVSVRRRAASIQGAVIGKKRLEVLCRSATGPAASPDAVRACPCCRRFLPGAIGWKDGTIGREDGAGPGDDQHPTTPVAEGGDRPSPKPALATRVGAAVAGLARAQSLAAAPPAAPPLAAGDRVRDYVVTKAIVQGWLYKKGTGGDWAGRRWWKPRWVTLALAENATTAVPTPVLLSHRAPGVPYPVSIVELTETTIIMAVERTSQGRESAVDSKGNEGHRQHPDGNTAPKAEWNRHCFQVVHTGHRHGAAARIFTAPVAERNEWVFAINNALLDLNKRRSRARSTAAKQEFSAAPPKKARPRSSAEPPHRGREERVSPWTNGDCGGGRMASPSPVRSSAALGLPPTSPRRSRSSGRFSNNPWEADWHSTVTP